MYCKIAMLDVGVPYTVVKHMHAFFSKQQEHRQQMI